MDPLTEAIRRGNERAVARLSEAGIDVVDVTFSAAPPLDARLAAVLAAEGRRATGIAAAEVAAASTSNTPDAALRLVEDLEANPWHHGPVREQVERNLDSRFEFDDYLSIADARMNLDGDLTAHGVLEVAMAVRLAEDIRLVHDAAAPAANPLGARAADAVREAMGSYTGTPAPSRALAARPAKTPTTRIKGADHGR